jgi:hypothetical protein
VLIEGLKWPEDRTGQYLTVLATLAKHSRCGIVDPRAKAGVQSSDPGSSRQKLMECANIDAAKALPGVGWKFHWVVWAGQGYGIPMGPFR